MYVGSHRWVISHLADQSLIYVAQALPETSTPGLINGTIYEIPTDPSSLPGTYNVTATYLNVTCASSSNITDALEAYKVFSEKINEVAGCDWNIDHGFCNLCRFLLLPCDMVELNGPAPNATLVYNTDYSADLTNINLLDSVTDLVCTPRAPILFCPNLKSKRFIRSGRPTL